MGELFKNLKMHFGVIELIFLILFQSCHGCSRKNKIKYSECIAEDGGFSEVTSPAGTYKGIRQGCVFDEEMQYWNEFRGIRYAFKPNRFEKSVQVVPSDRQIDAIQYGSQCPQYKTTGYPEPYFVGNEDCLFLNIMR